MTKHTEHSLDWYFDFISPYAYLQHVLLTRLQSSRPGLTVNYYPVLFAGLLKHNANKGPAEIPAKRVASYRHCHWLADQLDIPFRWPAAHPFNPLPVLRLAIARECDPQVVDTLFQHIWGQPQDVVDFASLEAISAIEGFGTAAEETADPAVKEQLQRITDQAIDRGVFGVPTIILQERLFWGVDMTDMVISYLDNPALFDNDEYRRVEQLPVGKARSQ